MNIWKTFMCNADKDVSMKAIFAVMSSTWPTVKIRPKKKKKFRPVWDLNPGDTGAVFLPTELTSQLGAVFFGFKYTWINTTDKDVIMKAIFMNASWFSVIYSSLHGFIAGLNFSVFGFFFRPYFHYCSSSEVRSHIHMMIIIIQE